MIRTNFHFHEFHLCISALGGRLLEFSLIKSTALYYLSDPNLYSGDLNIHCKTSLSFFLWDFPSFNSLSLLM